MIRFGLTIFVKNTTWVTCPQWVPSEAPGAIGPMIDDVNLDHVVQGTITQDKKSLKGVNRQRQTGTGGPVWRTVCPALRFSQASGRLNAAGETARCSLLLAICMQSSALVSDCRFIDCVTAHGLVVRAGCWGAANLALALALAFTSRSYKGRGHGQPPLLYVLFPRAAVWTHATMFHAPVCLT